MELTPDQQRLFQIFHPWAHAYQSKALENKTRFVHYTTAEAAVNILKKKEFWMRKSMCMNDYMEIRYGFQRFRNVLSNELGKRFDAALENLFQGFSIEIEDLFNKWIPHMHADSFITCVSEHRTEEDFIGRLSMWRAYGKTTGVAVVLNSEPLYTPTDALSTFVSPVAYFDDSKFKEEFGKVITNIESNAEFLRQQGREALKGCLFRMFAFGVICTKHRGFEEEHEWRVIHCPWWWASTRLQKEVVILQGAPQPIYKIPLKDIPEENLRGIEIPALLERLIIGPTKDPLAIWEAFRDLLTEAGVANAHEKIVVSDIPLRY